MNRKTTINYGHGLLFVLLCLLMTSAVADATSPRHHVWDKTPIKITLPVGIERRIEFPAPIGDLKIPAPIADPVSRIQLTPDGRLYWLATIPWETQRVIAQTADGYIYLLDVQASEEYGEPNPLIIEHPKAGDAKRYAPENIAPKKGYDYVDLTRFAAQHMHGPARLIKPLPGVTRVPVKQRRVDHLFRGDQLRAEPVAQWRSPRPQMYVTAVKVTNKTRYPVALQPLNLRNNEGGTWLFAASHHPGLNPRGMLGDSSFWYLVSRMPFGQAVEEVLGGETAKIATVTPGKTTTEEAEPDDELVDGILCCK